MHAHPAPSQPHSPVPSDSELTDLAQGVLIWYRELLSSGVKVSAIAGWLTLSGEVSSCYQRQDAETCLRHLPGVVGIHNDITLRLVNLGVRGLP